MEASLKIIKGSRLFTKNYPAAKFLYEVTPDEFAKQLQPYWEANRQILVGAFGWAGTKQGDAYWRWIDTLSDEEEIYRYYYDRFL